VSDHSATFLLTAAGSRSRERADTEDEEPDIEAVRGGDCPGVPARGEPEGGAAGEGRYAAGVLGGVPQGAGGRGASRWRQGLASGLYHFSFRFAVPLRIATFSN
jgi:hypothetical protein